MSGITGKKLEFGHRRGIYVDITDHPDQPLKVDHALVDLQRLIRVFGR